MQLKLVLNEVINLNNEINRDVIYGGFYLFEFLLIELNRDARFAKKDESAKQGTNVNNIII